MIELKVEIDGILKCSRFVADELRPSLRYIHISKTEYVATEGRVAMIYSPNIQQELEKPVNIIFSRDCLEHLRKISGMKHRPRYDTVDIIIDGEKATLYGYKQTFELSGHIDGEFEWYADWGKALPTGEPQATSVVHFNVALLEKFGKIPLIIRSYGDQAAVVHSADSLRWVGLIMPLRTDNGRAPNSQLFEDIMKRRSAAVCNEQK